jgi:hypothetical protein
VSSNAPPQSAHDPYILAWLLANEGPQVRKDVVDGAVELGPWTEEQRALEPTSKHRGKYKTLLHQQAWYRIWPLRDNLGYIVAVERGHYVLTDAGRAATEAGLVDGGQPRRVGQPFPEDGPIPDAREAPKIVFDYDPDARDRQTRQHEILVQRLRLAIQRAGREPLAPSGSEPRFDIGFYAHNEETLVVIEVKSLSDDSAIHQLRLGLGQVLHYAHVLSAVGPVRPALAVPVEPPAEWAGVCERAGVVLVVADHLDEAVTHLARADQEPAID